MKSYRQSTNIEDKRRESKAASVDRNPKPLHYRPLGNRETQITNARTLNNMADKSGKGAKRLLHGALLTQPGKNAKFLEPTSYNLKEPGHNQNYGFRKKK